VALILASVGLLVLVVLEVSVESSFTHTFLRLVLISRVLSTRSLVSFLVFPDSSLSITLSVSASLFSDEALSEFHFSCRLSS